MTSQNTLIDESTLRKKMMGCWLGKAVGGTLGMPYEGVEYRLDLDFYDPVPSEMIPNDDLDLQVVAAHLLDQMKTPRVHRDVFIPMWTDHIGMSPDEYGICKRNIALGLLPPHTGSFDNWFAHGMGAAIRTELWACLAPGDPGLAAAYAYEDACLDHAGEGVYAAQFLAALQSLAFVESDRDTLLDAALKHVPADSAIARSVQDTRQWWSESGDWVDVQKKIMAEWGHENFTNVTHNVAFTILGWLASDQGFGKGICVAVNCGQDADCTGATLGALLGIIDPDGIESKWLEPIGRDLVLSPSIHLKGHPDTLDAFTDQVMDLRRRIDGNPPPATPERKPPSVTVAAEIGCLPVTQSRNQGTYPVLDPHAPLPKLGAMQAVEFPGSVAKWPIAQFTGGTLAIRYCFDFDEPTAAKVLFNTPETVHVYIDGQFAFGREGGRMCPAMHRAPANQMTRHQFTPGTHEVVALIDRPNESRDIEWVFALGTDSGDNLCDNWLTGIYKV